VRAVCRPGGRGGAGKVMVPMATGPSIPRHLPAAMATPESPHPASCTSLDTRRNKVPSASEPVYDNNSSHKDLVNIA